MPPFLLALSGPTCSGKTTIAHHLQHGLHAHGISSEIIHADDFFKTDSSIPLSRTLTDMNGHGVQDWDCADALDLASLESVLDELMNGTMMDIFEKKKKRQGDGIHAPVVSRDIFTSRKDLSAWSSTYFSSPPFDNEDDDPPQVVMIEGFLLVGKSLLLDTRIPYLFTHSIVIHIPCHRARTRRDKRNPYVTLEGFWEDPAGYFDSVVWPNYVREHEWILGGEEKEEKKEEEEEGMRVETCAEDGKVKVKKVVVGKEEAVVTMYDAGDDGLDTVLEFVLDELERALMRRKAGTGH